MCTIPDLVYINALGINNAKGKNGPIRFAGIKEMALRTKKIGPGTCTPVLE